MKVDRVFTINDYYDGPRLGIAEVSGIPHIYEAEFDHSTEEYGDTYFLSPVEKELLALVIEDWEIWCRWDNARKRGEATNETHPALPYERPRHEELKRLIGGRLKSNPTNRKRYRGVFSTPPECQGTWKGTVVQWEPA
jgi:hypothetical protein